MDHYTSNAPGFDGGLGLTYKFSRFANERLYAEARYVYMDNKFRPGVTNTTAANGTYTGNNFFPRKQQHHVILSDQVWHPLLVILQEERPASAGLFCSSVSYAAAELCRGMWSIMRRCGNFRASIEAVDARGSRDHREKGKPNATKRNLAHDLHAYGIGLLVQLLAFA